LIRTAARRACSWIKACLSLGDRPAALDDDKILKRIDREMVRVLFAEIYP